MYEFEFERPTTLSAAVAALTKDDAIAIAGGQTLIPTLKNRLARPSSLVSLASVPELKGGVQESGASVTLMSMTTHAEAASLLEDSIPALASLAANIGILRSAIGELSAEAWPTMILRRAIPQRPLPWMR